ncbi:MAG: ABC transporter ATP-binding protein [Actinobacteria bacterium]|nr:ABC transporter ATP-binding protein [Actinomycetota bacterium]
MADTITVSDVTKEYGTTVKTKALRGVSFRVENKEFLSIIGQSGSGKSTLLNLLGLLDRPTEGTVSLLGTDVGALSKKERAAFRNKHLGFVFQFHHLLPEFSVRENLLIPTWIGGLKGAASTATQTRKRAEEILDFLGVGQVADKSAEQISGGQKQRVAIGRALMNSPDILLADEPTGNLDTENSALVYDLFRRIHDEMGTTFVIVTHDRAIAQQTDRIIEVTDGLISEDVKNEYLDAPAIRP